MLSAEHVRARVKNGELVLSPLRGKERARALELAELVIALARGNVGASRAELLEALTAVEHAPRERRLLDGLVKLVIDACRFSEGDPEGSLELRRELFGLAARARRAASDLGAFDRGALLDEAARTRGRDREHIERALYADLRGAHELVEVDALSPTLVVSRWERGQVQAVLLRATHVSAEIRTRSPLQLRAVFRKLKFHRLLYEVHAVGADRHRIEVEGPYSMFEAVTKYGLELALLLPVLEECDELELTADVRWGKQRERVRFRHSSSAPASPVAADDPLLTSDVRALLEAFRALSTPWTVGVPSIVLTLPGVGACMPDLVFSHPSQNRPFYLEVLGYWSRDAVWRRVELVERGLPDAMLFAVSSRLRVSEEVLDPDASAALYVYKGVMSPRAIERKLDALAQVCARRPPRSP